MKILKVQAVLILHQGYIPEKHKQTLQFLT